MPTGTGLWSNNSQYALRLAVSLSSQNIAANTSTVAYTIWVDKASGSGIFSGAAGRSVTLSGDWSGSFTWSYAYDFSQYWSLLLSSGTVTFTHNADGTRTVVLGINGSDPTSLGSAYAGVGYTLPTIPRATTPTVAPTTVDAGVSALINLPRASSGFTHDINYSFGSLTGQTAGLGASTGVGTSTTFIPPLALLNEIPTSTSGVVPISVTTKSGATTIGSPRVANLTVRVPAAARPTIGSLNLSDATVTPDIDAIVGTYVQGLSRLNASIVGANGIYGSSVESGRITVGSQTIHGYSGTTTNPLGVSGTVNVQAEVTDSRGKTSAFPAQPINVLPYAPPQIPAIQVRRSDAAGVVDNTDGTYIRVDLTAEVQSLINGTQRNNMFYRVFTSPQGADTWTQRGSDVNVGGLAFNSSFVVANGAPYSVLNSFDVRVEVYDNLGTVTRVERSVATGAVLLDLNEGLGVGIGKYHEDGALDVFGGIYNNGYPVITTNDRATTTAVGITELATNAETQTGSDTTRAVTPAGLATLRSTDLESIAGTAVDRFVTPASMLAMMENRGLPVRTAHGVTAVSATAGGGSAPVYWNTQTTISFPAGRFSTPPALQVTIVDTTPGGGSVMVGHTTEYLSAVSFSVRLNRIGANPPAGYRVHWFAYQF